MENEAVQFPVTSRIPGMYNVFLKPFKTGDVPKVASSTPTLARALATEFPGACELKQMRILHVSPVGRGCESGTT